MLIYGLQSVLPLLPEEHYQFKLLANETGVVVFPIEIEHRDAGQHGIRYADNYEGNALAAMVKPGCVAFRFHQQFSDQRVQNIAREIFALPELSFAAQFNVTYQNRLLMVARIPCDLRR